MKLVELLARELSEWPAGLLGNDGMTQDKCGDLNTMDTGKSPDFHAGDGVWHGRSHSFLEGSNRVEVASDYATAVVTKEQWQAERDKQKGGEWKRHRGGKCPVDAAQKVGYKFRGGDQGECLAGHLMWDHQQDESDVMQYRVISQPQAEEVGSISESVHKPIIEAFNSMAAEWHEDQIDGPIKWRDTVNELDAYIEEFTRERESLINRLALEGFALLPAMTAVMWVAPFSLPYAEWKVGDLVTSKVDYNNQFTKGKRYTVTGTNVSLGEKRVSVEADDKGEANGWLANQFEFHSRP